METHALRTVDRGMPIERGPPQCLHHPPVHCTVGQYATLGGYFRVTRLKIVYVLSRQSICEMYKF